MNAPTVVRTTSRTTYARRRPFSDFMSRPFGKPTLYLQHNAPVTCAWSRTETGDAIVARIWRNNI